MAHNSIAYSQFILGYIHIAYPEIWFFPADFQEPYAIVVLLQYDLVVVDLTSPNYPCFENPYPMDIHESPVTACQYYANCPPDLIPAFYSVGSSRQKRTGFSEKVGTVGGVIIILSFFMHCQSEILWHFILYAKLCKKKGIRFDLLVIEEKMCGCN